MTNSIPIPADQFKQLEELGYFTEKIEPQPKRRTNRKGWLCSAIKGMPDVVHSEKNLIRYLIRGCRFQKGDRVYSEEEQEEWGFGGDWNNETGYKKIYFTRKSYPDACLAYDCNGWQPASTMPIELATKVYVVQRVEVVYGDIELSKEQFERGSLTRIGERWHLKIYREKSNE
jgi:hypothetical protein